MSPPRIEFFPSIEAVMLVSPQLKSSTHLNKGISVSDNEIASNWILKKIYDTHWHSDRILPRILIGSYPRS